MTKRELKSQPTWTDVKDKLAAFDRTALVDLSRGGAFCPTHLAELAITGEGRLEECIGLLATVDSSRCGKSQNTSRLLGTDLSHLLNNHELDAIFARHSQPNAPGSRAGYTGDRGRVLTAFERQVLGARAQGTFVPNWAIPYLAGPHHSELGQRYFAATLRRR
jgi:hypothetical protein